MVAFLAVMLMGNLASVLRGMHPPGRTAGSVEDIASPFESESDAEDLLASWADWAADRDLDRSAADPTEQQKAPSPWVVTVVWLVFDSVLFAPALAVALVLALRRRARLLDQRSWLVPVVELGVILAVLYLGFDELENVATGYFVFAGYWLAISWISAVKLVLLALALIPLLLSYVRPVRRGAVAATPPIMPTVRALRMPIAAVVALALVMTQLPGSVRPQLYDVVRSWAKSDRPGTGIAALVALGVFMAMLWAAVSLVRRRAVDAEYLHSSSFSTRRLFLLLGAGVAVVAVSIFAPKLGVFPLARAWIPGMIVGCGLAIYALLSWPPPVRPGQDREAPAWNENVARAVVIVPALAFAAMTLSAIDLTGSLTSIIFLSVVFAAVPIGLAAAGWFVARVDPGPAAWPILAGGAALGVAVCFTSVRWRIGTVDLLGSLAIVVAALAILAAGLVAVEYLISRPPRGAFARLRLTRVPVLTMLLGIVVLASFLDKHVEFHAVRTLGRTPDVGAPDGSDALKLSAKTLFRSYDGPPAPPASRIRPVFVVAAEGGGGRAAYWTLNTLNCLFGGVDPENGGELEYPACDGTARWDRVLAASGISGGSVGLALYANAATPAGDEAGGAAPALDASDVFGNGYLDPVVANLAVIDLPNAALHVDTWMDRAEALERAFEETSPGMTRGYFATQLVPRSAGSASLSARFPILMLNSASVEDGCRINVSVVRMSNPARLVDVDGSPEPSDRSCRTLSRAETSPSRREASGSAGREVKVQGALASTREVADYVCFDDGADIRLSTAALLSARFPLVSPSGALEACQKQQGDTLRTFAVDGGLVESSGASPVVELLQRLIAAGDAEPGGKCVQPVVLQVDNGYADIAQPTEPRRPQELIAPLTGFQAAAGSRSAAARQALANLATGHRCPGLDDATPTYFHLYPQAHPGTQAPLGWGLSAEARRDLDGQLAGDRNQCALLGAKAWLTDSRAGFPTCLRVAPTGDVTCVLDTAATSPDQVVPPVRSLSCRDEEDNPIEPEQMSERAAPRPFVLYNVCPRDASDCADVRPGSRCGVPIDAADLPCSVVSDQTGTVRLIFEPADDSSAGTKLLLASRPTGTVRTTPNDPGLLVWALLLAAALALIALVVLLTLGPPSMVKERVRALWARLQAPSAAP